MRRLLVLLLVLGVLAAVADRAGAELAGRAVASELQDGAGLAAPPDVDVRGVPFLTQALQGRYEQVDVRATDVPAGDLTVEELTATLTGVRAPLSQVLDRSLTQVPIERVEARALLSYDALARRSGDRRLTLAPAGDRVRVTGSARVLGRTLTATAVSTVELRGDVLVITAQDYEVGDAAADRALTRALRDRFDLEVPVRDLPYGLRLTSLSVEPEGVRLLASARDAVVSTP